MQDGFRLVIGRVSHHHVPRAEFGGNLRQKFVAEPTGTALDPLTEIVGVANAQLPPDHRQSEPVREPRYEVSVRGRRRPQIVFGMHHDQPPLGVGWHDAPQRHEERHTVGSPRHGGDDGHRPQAFDRERRPQRGDEARAAVDRRAHLPVRASCRSHGSLLAHSARWRWGKRH